MLTAINFAVNFLCKLSSVGTVDVVDVVKDLCVCSVVGRCRSRNSDYLGSSLKATLTKQYDYYEKVHPFGDNVRPSYVALNMGNVQFTNADSRPIHYRTYKSVNGSIVLSNY